MNHSTALLRASFVVVVAAALTGVGGPARADDDEARTLYIKTCSKCHGLVTERVAEGPEALLTYVVTMPLGPNLSTVYGRPAGSVEDYPYSRAMRKITNGWVWDEETLDLWLTSTQDMIRGSMMFLRVPDAGIRQKIIGYLKKYARYDG